MNKLLVFTLLFMVLGACSVAPPPSPTSSPTFPASATVSPSISPTPTITPTVTAELPPTPTSAPTQGAGQACALQPIIVPTRPAKIPQTNQLDETTGMHMTGIVQQLDLASYRLKVTGKVDHPLSLTLDELRCMPKVTATPLLACGDLFKDSAEWGGVPIQEILTRASVQAGAKTVTLLGADGYNADIDLDDALKQQNYLAYEWEGQPVPILHGFPLRAVFPDFGGWAWVKWLVGIDVK